MISSSSDTLTVGIILLLLFGAICFYLYSRIIQGEKKISLLENILLDLKVATESSMLNIPDQTEAFYMESASKIPSMASMMSASRNNDNTITELDETDDVLESMRYEVFEETAEEYANEDIDIVKRVIEEQNEKNQQNEQNEPLPTPSPIREEQKQVEVSTSEDNSIPNASVFVNKTESAYEHMTVKELQAIAKSKGLSVSGLKRAQVIEALKAYDNAPASVAQREENDAQPMSFDNMGEVGEPMPMDAPGTLMEANFIE